MHTQHISERKTYNKQTKRGLVLVSLMVSTFLAAIEGTIVATAMPSIIGDLGGFSLYSWVFSSFFLMNALTTLIYGKLADLFGRKPIFIFGVAVFLTGSLLCGFSTSMIMLVLSRFIQGMGAGAVQPMAQTIVGDMYSVKERAKIQGYLSSVWGVSAVLGPLAGGLIVRYADWAWIFWLNVPLGLIGMFGVILFLHENIEKEQRKVDYIGSSLILVSISSLMVVLIQGGVVWPWTSWPVVVLLSVFVISIIFFLWHENRTEAPMMPLGIWKKRLITMANLATLTSGMIMIGLTSFIPTFVQGVMGYSAIIAGFALTMMSVGWSIIASFTGFIFLKVGYRPTAVLGGIAMIIGGLIFIQLQGDMSPVWAGAGSFFTGIGMGLTATTFIVSIQNSVDWKTRGIATSSNMFMRMLGSSLGAAALGGILNMRLKHYFASHDGQASSQLGLNSVNELLSNHSGLSEQTLAVLKDAVALGLHSVFIGILVLGILTLLLTLFFQSKKPYNLKKSNGEYI